MVSGLSTQKAPVFCTKQQQVKKFFRINRAFEETLLARNE